MVAGGGDGVVAHGVAVGARPAVERALDDALTARVREHGVEVADDVVEPVLRGVDGLAELTDLVRVLDQSQLGQVAGEQVVGGWRPLGLVRATDRCADAGVERTGQVVVGFTDEQRRRVECVGDGRERPEVGRGQPEVGGDGVERGARTDPELPDLGVGVELFRVAARGGAEVQRGVVAGAVRRHHEHGADDGVGAPTGQVREGGVRAERVVAVVRADLGLPGRHHDRAARVQLGDARATLGGERGLLAGLGLRFRALGPLRPDEVLEGRGPGGRGSVARRAGSRVGHASIIAPPGDTRPVRPLTCG